MTSAAQAWQVDFERVRESLSSLRGSGDDVWQVNRLEESMRDLGDRLAVMEKRPLDYAFGQGELERRRAALEAIRQEVNTARGSMGIPPRDVSTGGRPAVGGVGGGGGGSGASRLEQQRQTMLEHDRMLADLGRGVGRLKTQSAMINEETSLHVRLLDGMEGDAERASAGLQTEARHAQKIREKSKTFNLYVIIVVLSIILAVLVFTGL